MPKNASQSNNDKPDQGLLLHRQGDRPAFAPLPEADPEAHRPWRTTRPSLWNGSQDQEASH